MPTIDEILELEKALSGASQVECSPEFTYCSPEFVKFCEASMAFAPKAARALKIAMLDLINEHRNSRGLRRNRLWKTIQEITKELES